MPDDKELKRKKHQKKMTRIISKAWGLPESEPFQESHHHSSDNAVYDLTTIGQYLDSGHYSFDKQGWLLFARDVCGVYNRHVAKKGRHAKVASQHVEQVLQWLEKVNPGLIKVGADYTPPVPHHHHHGKKRRSEGENGGGPARKKHASDKSSKHADHTPLTISEREAKAMESLAVYIEEHGGSKKQASKFHCKTTKRSDGRCENTFYNSDGRRFRNMVDVARFLGLVADHKSVTKKAKTTRKTKKKMTHREVDNEKKKLKRELEKLHKQHLKATKNLDDFQTEQKESRYPVEDDIFMQEDAEKGIVPAVTQTTCPAARVPDIKGFPGIPAHCIPDLLMVWDFLCTFSRALSLNPIPLDDFAAALTYNAQEDTNTQGSDGIEISPPVCLAEAHLGLLRLMLNDPSSDDWWWSTLETDDLAAVADVDFAEDAADASNQKGENNLPVIKVDMAALLSAEEDPIITTSWLQTLEQVRSQAPTNGQTIRQAVKTALGVVANKWVKAYLKTAIRKGKGNSAGFTKRAVLWLVDKVRDARPDLWERNVTKETVYERSAKVAEEAATAMEKLDDSVEAVTVDDTEGESDDDSDEDSDDEDEADAVEAAGNASAVPGDSPSLDESETPVRSVIPVKPPPSLVDLLLPPSKPAPSSDIVSPFTWPFIAGASACRILHRYKRRRNEVDDSERDFRELPPMSIAERRSREAVAPMRILTECVARDGETSPLEKAIDHLCKGRTYLALSAVERLCVFRLLVEAAYDTNRVYEVVNDNFKSRINALKALEMEERRAKREAREEAAAAEAAARSQLAEEAKIKFIEEKRKEITDTNIETNEYTAEVLNELTDEEIAEFDEETKADYEALPGPESFSKTQVNKMVARMHQEAAFGTHSLLVLTMDEIVEKDIEDLKEMELQLASYGENQTLDREMSKNIERLRKDIDNAKYLAESLPEVRESAVETLQDAIEDGTIKVLRAALRMAKQAKLTGPDHDTEGIWALDLMRDAALELKTAESRKRVTDAQKDLVAKRNKCFIRTEPLGRDRFRNRFWHFDPDLSGRVWVEADYISKNGSSIENGDSNHSGYVNLMLDTKSIAICEEDRTEDLIMNGATESSEANDKSSRFSCQEYHASGSIASLAKRFWGAQITEKSFRSLIKHLDRRGVRENELRANLKTTLEDSGLTASAEGREEQIGGGEEKSSDDHDATEEYRTSGDEEVYAVARTMASQSSSSVVDVNLIEGTSSAIGTRVRVREVLDPAKVPILANYAMATVFSWKMHTEEVVDEDGEDQEENENPEIKVVTEPVWRVLFDNGEEAMLNGTELIESLCRAIKWQNECPGYSESDGAFLAYRNSLGRFCGRAADAAQASTPTVLARLMVKREQELYTRIKNRSFDNNWGGKSGARNAWISTMRDYCHELTTLRNGLVTLEGAFFELTGAFADDNVDHQIIETRSAKSLLSDDSSRFEIELESLEKQLRGLWNSRESRSIFHEIVESSTTTGFLALAFDLLCRNCWAYLNAHKFVEVGRNAVTSQQPSTTTRRMNAWQQANRSLYY